MSRAEGQWDQNTSNHSLHGGASNPCRRSRLRIDISIRSRVKNGFWFNVWTRQDISTSEVNLTIRRYKDNDPLVDLCVKAQQYYEEHSVPTRVKACSCITIDEILQLSGVAAHTIPPEDLAALALMNESKEQLDAKSLFKPKKFTNGYGHQQRRTYIDDEAKYRVEFAASENGKGQFRLYQVKFFFP